MGGKRPSRIERIIKATANMGKYAGLASLAFTLGCFNTVPNRISVSGDGRYLVVPFTQKGEIYRGDSSEGKPSFVVVDLDTLNMERTSEVNEQVFYVSNSKDRIVFNSSIKAKNEYGKEVEESTAVILTKNKEEIIKNAMYPTLSDDGNLLIYSKIKKEEKLGELPSCKLILRDLRDNSEKDLKLNGVFADISPDGKHVSFIEYKPDLSKAKQDFYLTISDIDGRDKKTICRVVDSERLMRPHWVNNDYVIFKTKTEFTGSDVEVFAANTLGEIRQVTNNVLSERYPQGSEEKAFYLAFEPKIGSRSIFCSELDKKSGIWKHKSLEINADSYVLAGERVIFANNKYTPDPNDIETFIYVANMNDLYNGDKSKILNLGEIIRDRYFQKTGD